MLLHTADWHLGKQIESVDLLPDQWDWFMRFCDDLKERSPELILIAGDLFDYHADKNAAKELFDAVMSRIITEIGCPIAVVPGNHDDIAWLGECFAPYEDRVTVFDAVDAKPAVYTVDGYPVMLHPIPFWSGKALAAFGAATVQQAMQMRLAQIRQNMPQGYRHIAAAHALVLPKGAPMVERILKANKDSGNDLIDSAWFADFDYTALGHIHANMAVEADTMPQNSCCYAGTPFVYERKEIGQQKGYFAVTFHKDGVDAVSCSLPPVHPVKLLVSNFTEIEKSPPEWAKDAYVFLQLEDTVPVADGMQRMKTLFPHLVQMRYEKEPEPYSYDLNTSMGERFVQFLRKVGAELTPQEITELKKV